VYQGRNDKEYGRWAKYFAKGKLRNDEGEGIT
jgi:hypothetical protein